MTNLKSIGVPLTRAEMRKIIAGEDQSTTIGDSGGSLGMEQCLDWPGCFENCDCGVYNCHSGIWVHCATMICRAKDGTKSSNKRCSC